MTERITKSLDEMSMAELWSVAKLLGISKEGKRDELVARIKQAEEENGESNPPSQNQPSSEEPSTTEKKETTPKEVAYISRYNELKLVVDPSYLKEVGVRVLTIRGKYIQFHEGVFRTADPEEIAFLDNHPNYGNVFTRVKPVDLKGKTLEQIYKEKFKTLEERERELALREGAVHRKEIESKGNQEGESEVAGRGIRDTTDQPKF